MSQLNSIMQIRLPNGSAINIVDWTDRPLYSTADVLNGATDNELGLFTYVVSDSVAASSNISTQRTASERDTNISTPSGMASTEEMLVYNIRCEYFQLHTDATNYTDATTAVADQPMLPIPEPQVLAGWMQQIVLRLYVSQKVYAEAGIGWFSTGFGPMVSGGPSAAGTAGGNDRYAASAGLPSAEAIRSYVIPHHIGAQEKYRVTLFNPDGAQILFRGPDGATTSSSRTLLRTRVYLDGLYKRPVS